MKSYQVPLVSLGGILQTPAHPLLKAEGLQRVSLGQNRAQRFSPSLSFRVRGKNFR